MIKTVPFKDVDIVLHYPDQTTETFRLQAPNADDPFEYRLRRIPILPAYRDGNYTLQKGFEKYQFACSLRYNWHRMDNPWKLLVSEFIELRVPPRFGDDPEALYQSFDVFLENEEVLRNWLKGLVVAQDGTTQLEANPVPPGSITLDFAGITPFTELEFLELPWHQPFAGRILDDAHTFNIEPDVSHNLLGLGVKNDDNFKRHMFIKADFIGLGPVTSATLRLWCTGVENDIPDREISGFYGVVAAANDWSEETITWNNDTGLIGIGSGLLNDQPINEAERFYTWDITQAANDAIAASGIVSFKFLLNLSQIPNGVTFGSKESLTPPQIVTV